MAKNYKILVSTGAAGQVTDSVDVAQFGGDKDQPVRIRAKAGAQYLVHEIGRGTHLAPDYVKVRRKGNSLEVTFEMGSKPDLIIEDYYSTMPNGHIGLIGQAEDGLFYEFTPENPTAQGLIPGLLDGAPPTLAALGGSGVAVFELAALPLVAAAFPSGLLGAGAAVAAAGLGGGGGGSDSGDAGGAAPVDASVAVVELRVDLDANNDGFVNRAEKGTATTTSLSASFDPARAAVGDVLTITEGGVTRRITLTADDVKAGKVTSTGWALPAEGGTLAATATLTGPDGKISPEATKEAVLDTSALRALGTRILTDSDAENGNGLIGQPELAATDGQLRVQVELPVDAKVGDVLLITGTGSSPQSIVLSSTHIQAGKVTVDFPAPANGVTFESTARLSDAAGNSSATVGDSAVISTQATNAPTVTILEDTNKDGAISATELQGLVQVNVRAPTGAVVGDSLVITTPLGVLPAFTLTQETLTGGVTIDQVAPQADGPLTFTAVHTTAAGTPSPEGTATARLDRSDLSTGLGLLIITDKDNSGIINKAELTESGVKVTVRINLPAGASVGDTLTLTGSGNTAQTIELTKQHLIDTFVTTGFNPTQSGTDFTATATLGDMAGNRSVAVQDTAAIRTVSAAEPTITFLEDANKDNTLNRLELSGSVEVEYGLPATAAAGDTLVITRPDGSKEPVVLAPGDITAGKVTRTYDAPPDAGTLNTSAQMVDAAGNPGAMEVGQLKIDTRAPSSIGLRIVTDSDSENGNGLVGQDELTATEGVLRVEVLMLTNAKAGDVLMVTGTGGAPRYIAITNDHIQAGKLSLDFTALDSGAVFEASAQVTDPAGNTTETVRDAATLDLSDLDTGLAIKIGTDSNANKIINAAELDASGARIDVTVSLPAGAALGDKLTVSGSGNAPQVIPLTEQNLKDGFVTARFNPTNNGTTFVATATLQDAAANSGGPVEERAVIRSTLPGEPTISFPDDNSGQDGILSASESTDPVAVEYALPATAAPGDTLVITRPDGTVERVTLKQEDIDAQKVIRSYALPADGETLTTSAKLVDAANNPGATESQSLKIDQSAPNGGQAVALTIDRDLNNDGFINGEEKDTASTTSLTARFDKDTVAVGDVVTFSVGDTVQKLTLSTQAMVDAGSLTSEGWALPVEGASLTATATLADPAGNSTTQATREAVIDTSRFQGLAIDLTTDANKDQQIGLGELGGNTGNDNLRVAITLPLDAQAGDFLLVTGTANESKRLELTAGHLLQDELIFFFTAPANGITFQTTAHLIDEAGNVSTIVDDVGTINTQGSGAPIVKIVADGDNDGRLTTDELAANIQVVISAPLGAVVGDRIEVTLPGNITQTYLLDLPSLSSGIVLEYPLPTEDVVLTFTAIHKNSLGNPSASGSDTVTLDRSDPIASAYSQEDLFPQEIAPISLMSVLGSEAMLDLSGMKNVSEDLPSAPPPFLDTHLQGLSLGHLLDMPTIQGIDFPDLGFDVLDKGVHLPMDRLLSTDGFVSENPSVYALFNPQTAHEWQQFVDQVQLNAAVTM